MSLIEELSKKENHMIALEIKGTKNMMNSLLASEQFDSFLVEEVVVTTFNTFHIDGHLVKEFYSSEELEALGISSQPAAFSGERKHPFLSRSSSTRRRSWSKK